MVICGDKPACMTSEFDFITQRVNSNLQNIPAAELILELQARGIDMTSAIEQIQAERRQQEKGKIILFPKSQIS